ncbi:MAG: PTS system trehalose-specific EIIBC component [Streptococcaceae bacterium]|jgi:PTS system trehalose-specific IIC component|nr:PTS system trehalose-specific EIIBC component [Streptococcaceae bacterium]MCH4176328.1 PTS system trehalose-specific EIIBC component [Streptococcaceae bacterium]
MGKFEKDAKDLLEAIGGRENVVAVTHCATRMRFVLGDDNRADKDKIEKIPAVKGMFTNAGQFQVIIGNDVSVFYQDFSKISGIEAVSKEAAKSAAKANQNLLQRLVATLAEIFTPLLPAIIVGGLILGLRNILEGVPFGFLGDQTIVEVSQFWSGVNSFLWLPGEAIFHFLPVGVTWSVTRKMGGTQILGIVLGITLVSPQLLNAYAVNSTSAAEIAKNWTWDFGFFTIDKIGYQAQVLPAMFAGFLLVYLERFFRKHIPEAVSMIFVPLLALLPTIIAAHVIIGPIGWKIGTGISWVVNTGLTSSFSWLFGGIFGGLYAPLVITGLHHTTLAIDSQLIADFGSTNLWPMICLSNIAQGAAVLGVIIAHKGDKKEQEVSVPSLISAWLGVTEPAMFGINLKFMYPFVAGMIGSAVAGMFVTFMKVRANAIGVGGLPGILAIRGKDMPVFAIAMVIAIVIPIVVTLTFRKLGILNKAEAELSAIESDTGLAPVSEVTVSSVEISAPLAGQVKPLSEAKDPVFSQGALGQGAVIEPKDGHLVAPFDGVVVSLFPSKHAIGLVSDEGVELLIHIGLDTVELDGKYFTAKVEQGNRVVKGQDLIEFDVVAIQAAGYVTETPIVVTNTDKFQADLTQTAVEVAIGDALLTAKAI